MNQRLVTKKNRKVRLLRELYPDVKCRIFYQRDYIDLLIKYGLERPSQGLPSQGKPRKGKSGSGGEFLGPNEEARTT